MFLPPLYHEKSRESTRKFPGLTYYILKQLKGNACLASFREWSHPVRKDGGQVYLDFTGTETDPEAYPDSVTVYDMAAGAAAAGECHDQLDGINLRVIYKFAQNFLLLQP